MNCPDCHRDSLEIKKTFFGKKYKRCNRLFCKWDSRAAEAEHKKQSLVLTPLGMIMSIISDIILLIFFKSVKKNKVTLNS
jgi:hypothetical protein